MPRKKQKRKAPTETAPVPLGRCAVQGCDHLALERHTGPGGVVWLCGSCGMRARLDLASARVREEVNDMIARPFERLAAFREEQRRRIYS